MSVGRNPCLDFALLPGVRMYLAGAGEQLLVYDFPLRCGVTRRVQRGTGLLFVL